MKYLALLILLTVGLSAQNAGDYITELGVAIPVSTTSIKDYIAAHSVKALPFTSGYGNGVVVGRHAIITNHATVGLVFGANAFVVSDSTGTDQIYQANLYIVGRLYFGHSWRGGVYAELGSGPELSMAKFVGSSLVYQVNITSRVGVGYNYKFTDDVTIGATFLIAPSLTSSNYLDGSKVVISMLW